MNGLTAFAAIAGLIFAGGVLSVPRQEPPRPVRPDQAGWIVGKTEVYHLSERIRPFPQQPNSVWVSPTGAHVLAVLPSPEEPNLVHFGLFQVGPGRLGSVGQTRTGGQTSWDIEWVSDHEALLEREYLLQDGLHFQVWHINAQTGTSKPVGEFGSGEELLLGGHPKGEACFYVLKREAGHAEIFRFGVDGQRTGRIAIPAEAAESSLLGGQSEPILYLRGRAEPAASDSIRRTVVAYRLDFDSGSVTPLKQEQMRQLFAAQVEPREDALGVQLTNHRLVSQGTAAFTKAAWVYAVSQPFGKYSRALADVSIDQIYCAPSAERPLLAYSQSGETVLRKVETMSYDEYVKRAKSQYKAWAVNAGKQLGLASVIYAADYDDNMALQGQWADGIVPYIKDDSDVPYFSYTYSGGPLASIPSVADTEIGFVETPFGRAVVYANGHVKWKDNP